MGRIIRRTVQFTLAMPNAGAGTYEAESQLGGLNELANAVPSEGGTAYIESIIVTDRHKNETAIDFLFFDDDPGLVSADRADCEIPKASMEDSFLGFFRVTDYVTTKLSSGGYSNFGKMFAKSLPTKKSLYCVAVNRNAAQTFADGDLVVKINFVQGSSG